MNGDGLLIKWQFVDGSFEEVLAADPFSEAALGDEIVEDYLSSGLFPLRLWGDTLEGLRRDRCICGQPIEYCICEEEVCLEGRQIGLL